LTLTIVGTGLIGSSFGLAMRQAGFQGAILGVSSPAAVADALAAGAIDRALPLEEAVPQSDLVFLAQAIGRIIDTIRHLDPLLQPGALVTDAGSTKREILHAARRSLTRAQFLGGHPMAGKETRGASAADPGLFSGRTWVLTPGDPTEMETLAAVEFRGWLGRIGARITVLDCEEHDRVVAFTSHLQQLASTALAATLEARVPSLELLAVSGPGALDMTRLALSSYELWRDILATNAGPIDSALAAYIQELEHIRTHLRTRELQAEFGRAAELATRLRASRQ
jgi:prephenate dehydrogenase